MEYIVRDKIMDHFVINKLFTNRQFGFYRATAMLSAVYAVVVCLCVCVPERDRHTHRQTDRHTLTAYTALSIAVAR